ncbi:TetR/AcrR family transcriptional regulator [Nonomuraea longicatena]|uniref:HTH tetR-type domain-containing protein n=1 Tax=Nonomuraea longicatena TaxID=83682 RepID=A0ABN1Q4Q7_9ACTN
MMTAVERKRRAGGDNRVRVLDQVVSVLVVRGYERTRFRDVSEASGVAVSTLQGYFGSREDMLIEALQHSTTTEVAEMERLAEGFEDPWRRLSALAERGLATPVPVWRMLMEFWTAAAHDEELRRHSERLDERYRRPFVSAVERGVEAGTFTPRDSAGAVVDVLIAAMDGLLYPRVLGIGRTPAEDYHRVVMAQLAWSLGVAE